MSEEGRCRARAPVGGGTGADGAKPGHLSLASGRASPAAYSRPGASDLGGFPRSRRVWQKKIGLDRSACSRKLAFLASGGSEQQLPTAGNTTLSLD
jgi:hypothetical protein